MRIDNLDERLALSTDKASIKRLGAEGQIIGNATDMIKDPYVLEFLGLEELPTYSENELETRIIDKSGYWTDADVCSLL